MLNNHDIELARNLLLAGKPLPANIAKMVSEILVSHADQAEHFVFSPADDGWWVGESGHEVFHSTRKSGYKFIHSLLKNPNKAIHCVQVFHDCTLTPQDIESIFHGSEKARVNVQKRIKSALEDIPGLIGKHLRSSIKTGFNCGYWPSNSAKWKLSQECHT